MAVAASSLARKRRRRFPALTLLFARRARQQISDGKFDIGLPQRRGASVFGHDEAHAVAPTESHRRIALRAAMNFELTFGNINNPILDDSGARVSRRFGAQIFRSKNISHVEEQQKVVGRRMIFVVIFYCRASQKCRERVRRNYRVELADGRQQPRRHRTSEKKPG